MTATDTQTPHDTAARPPVLLVAYDGSPMSEVQLHLASRSANDIGALVRVLYVVVRSRHLPLDVPLSHEEEATANALFDRAERIVTRYGVSCLMEVDRARSVGEAIVADAADSGARVIFMGLRDSNRLGASLFISGTLRHVLQNASCPVQIGYLPAGLPEQSVLDLEELVSENL